MIEVINIITSLNALVWIALFLIEMRANKRLRAENAKLLGIIQGSAK